MTATRAIIFDPSWNPCNDNQAADRCYRIGQLKDVVIYRLISCSTIEEKVYRKQVFKDAIFRSTTTEKENQYRYFTHSELRELFSLPQNPNISETQLQLESIHKASNNHYSEKLKQHLDTVKRQNKHIITGFSNHDLLYSKQADDVQYGAEDDLQISILADDSARALHEESIHSSRNSSTIPTTRNHRSKRKVTTLFDEERVGSSMNGRTKEYASSTKVVGLSPPPSEFSFLSEKENIANNPNFLQHGVPKIINSSTIPNDNSSASSMTTTRTTGNNKKNLPTMSSSSTISKTFSTPPRSLRRNHLTENKRMDYELSPSPTSGDVNDVNDHSMMMSPPTLIPVHSNVEVSHHSKTTRTSDTSESGDKNSSFEKIQRRLSSFFGLIDEEDENYEPSDDEEEQVLKAVKEVEDSKTIKNHEDDEYPIVDLKQDHSLNAKTLFVDDVAEQDGGDDEDEYEEEDNTFDDDDEGFICDDEDEYNEEDDDPTMKITPMKPPPSLDRDDDDCYKESSGDNVDGIMLFSPMTATHDHTNHEERAEQKEDYMMMSPPPIHDSSCREGAIAEMAASIHDDLSTSQHQEYSHEYLSLLREARNVELSGDLLYAIHLYMNALELCDGDINLHCKINYLANTLRFNDHGMEWK